jgi:hypothetical protein
VTNEFHVTGRVVKAADDLQVLYGWGNITRSASGEVTTDAHNEQISTAVLERAVVRWLAKGAGVSGEDHSGDADGVVVEAMVWTAEKKKVLGLADDALPEGLWLGVHIPDRRAYERRRDQKAAFSIQGRGTRRPIKENS